jgi:FMN phosphatase YigB (HAD superfamily)
VRCRSGEELIRRIQRRAAAIELVSFDVFDTLLRRQVDPPERSKIPSAQAIARLLAERGRPRTLEEVLAARRRVGDTLCEAATRTGADPDCHIRPWFRVLLADLLQAEPDEGDVDRLVEVECQAETLTCEANPGMIEAVRAVRAEGKRVIFISDSYLDEGQITRLLDHCGYAGLLDAGYASCRCGLLKRTGRLFQHVLKQEGISPKRWLHVGDNRLADVVACRRQGGFAVHFQPPQHARRVSRLRRLDWLERKSVRWQGAKVVEWCRKDPGPSPICDFAYDVGYWLLGPALANFVHCAIRRIVEEKIELAIFPARDGFGLQRIFERLAPHALPERKVASVYAFLSRSVVFPASVFEIGEREKQLAGAFSSQEVTLRDFLRRFALKCEPLGRILHGCGIESPDVAIDSLVKDGSLERFIRHPSFRVALRGVRENYAALLEDYLGEIGFWDAGRVALIDIGWQGTVQDSLGRAFGYGRRWPQLMGLYLGFLGHLPRAPIPRSTYEGILYDGPRDGNASNPVTHFLQLFEFATRAPHATATHLVRDRASGQVVPVLKSDAAASRTSEMQDRDVLVRVQSGVFDFAEAYARTIPFHDAPPSDYTPFVLMQLDRFLRLPRTAEARLFNVHNAEDFGIDRAVCMGVPSLAAVSLRKWREEFRNKAMWREGALASLALPGLTFLYHLKQTFQGRFS